LADSLAGGSRASHTFLISEADIGVGPESDAARKAEAQLAVINNPLQPTECEFHVGEVKVTHWKRLSAGKFEENWSADGRAIFVVTSRFEQGEQKGTIVFDKTRNIEVLLLDKGNTTAKPSWRDRGETEWKVYGEMRNAK